MESNVKRGFWAFLGDFFWKLSLKIQLKIEFLIPFTGSRNEPEKMPANDKNIDYIKNCIWLYFKTKVVIYQFQKNIAQVI